MRANKNKNKSWLIKILAVAIIVFFNGAVFGGVVMAQFDEDPTDIGSMPTDTSSSGGDDSAFDEGVDDFDYCFTTYEKERTKCENDAEDALEKKCGEYEPGFPTRINCEKENKPIIEQTKNECLKTAKTKYEECSKSRAKCGNWIIDEGEECDDGEGQGDPIDKYVDPNVADNQKQLDSCFKCKYVDVTYEFNVSRYLQVPEGQTYLDKTTNTDTEVSLQRGVIYFLVTGIEFATKIIAAFALLFIIVGGIVLMISSGNSSLQQKGKRLVLYAVLGLVIAFLSLIIVTAVQSLFYTT